MVFRTLKVPIFGYKKSQNMESAVGCEQVHRALMLLQAPPRK
jgi:hypothetical protein